MSLKFNLRLLIVGCFFLTSQIQASYENPADIVAVSKTIFLDPEAEYVELELFVNGVN